MRAGVRKGNKVFDSEIASTFFEHMLGLMFSDRKNILFVLGSERIFGIHSFFVFFPFDAVYLDEKKRIVDVVRGIAPFTLYVENKRPAKYLLELTEKNDLKVGDELDWRDDAET
ncbi:putative ACR [uncultured archaeon]|nr:putative ACR [uncultured archaeon]